MDSKHSEHQFPSVFPLLFCFVLFKVTLSKLYFAELSSEIVVCLCVCLNIFLGNTFAILCSVGPFLRQYIRDRTQILNNLFFIVNGRYFLFNVETIFHSNVKLSVFKIENEMNEEDFFHNFDEKLIVDFSCLEFGTFLMFDVFCC